MVRFSKTLPAVVVMLGSMLLVVAGTGCAAKNAGADRAFMSKIEAAAGRAEGEATKAVAAAKSATAAHTQATADKVDPTSLSRIESAANTAMAAANEARAAARNAAAALAQGKAGKADPAFMSRIEGAVSTAEMTAALAANKADAAAKDAAAALLSRPQPSATPGVRAEHRTELRLPKLSAAENIIGDDDLAVVVGIEKYRDLPASDFSADDARLVKDYLAALGFRQRNIQTLLNEGATQSSIRKVIETWLPNRVKPASHVLVYYSGHGAPDPHSGDAYLVPYDGDPNYLADTGYPLRHLYDKLGALPAKEVAVVLDACFSGAGGRSVLAKGARPLVMMKGSASLPANLAVLAAAQVGQISTSSLEKGHGVLTYYFLRAITDGKKDLAEIYTAIRPQVEDAARALNVTQTPSLIPDASELRGRFRFRN